MLFTKSLKENMTASGIDTKGRRLGLEEGRPGTAASSPSAARHLRTSFREPRCAVSSKEGCAPLQRPSPVWEVQTRPVQLSGLLTVLSRCSRAPEGRSGASSDPRHERGPGAHQVSGSDSNHSFAVRAPSPPGGPRNADTAVTL